jgi:hypothetical protein
MRAPGGGVDTTVEKIRDLYSTEWLARTDVTDSLESPLSDLGFRRRFGFDCEPASGFASPCAGPHFMVLALMGAFSATSGRVDHAPAFAALE